MTAFLRLYLENWSHWWPQLVPAMENTLGLTALSYLLALVLGIILAVGKLSKIRAVRAFCVGYIEFVRGIPALALLFLIYFGLVPIGLVVDSFTAAVIGLGMNQGAYMAEVFRGGIEALHKGQREAALAVGMTPYKAYRFIIMPQAVRIVLPPLLNMLIVLLKDTSICSLISTPELMLRAKDITSMSFLPMHIYLLVGLLYFMMAWPLSMATRRVEAYLGRGRRRGSA
jgi:His/Glu/Gln/Arg/opine family amino acid ABC transporter permease subunit